MPHFSWRGFSKAHKACYGTHYARDINRLRIFLSGQEITLIFARPARFYKAKSASPVLLSLMCEHLSSLLESGIRLDEALELASSVMNDEMMKAILYDSAKAVREGLPLSDIFSYHAPWIDELVITLTRAGEEAGCLAKTFKMLELHYKAQDEFLRKLKAALLTPCITLAFFILITLVILVVVIPRFEVLFTMLEKPIPPMTRTLFEVSYLARTYWPFVVSGIVLLFFICRYCLKINTLKRYRDDYLLKLPCIGNLIRYHSLATFLQVASLLLHGHVHLVKSLKIASHTVKNISLQPLFLSVAEDVERGTLLSEAFAYYHLIKYPDIISLCVMGEAIGNLDLMLQKAGLLYQKKAYSLIALISSYIPIILIVVLGILIGVLIFSVYTPLLSLSKVLG